MDSAHLSLAARLRTVQAVPCTAFDAAGNLNLPPMQALTNRLFSAGIRVFIPCAGSAEFHSLRAAEVEAGVRMTRAIVGEEGVVVGPVGGALPEAQDAMRQLAAAGAAALLVMPLEFPYLCDDGARDYLLALLDAAPRPLMIYKKGAFPSDALLLQLSGHPQLLGVKYAVNELDAFQRTLDRDGGKIEWFCGSAERFAPFFMLAGAAGYTSGAANLCPRLTLALHAAANRGDWSAAMERQRQLLPIEHFRARAGNSYNITFLKHALRAVGLDFGPPRPPQRRLTDAEMQEVDAVAARVVAEEEAYADEPYAQSPGA